jgi:hypothetical protein
MVDSVKNYGIAGVAANVQLGKGGAKIVGSNSDQVSFEDPDGNPVGIDIAEGTAPEHAVAQTQLTEAAEGKVSFAKATANFDDASASFGTASANTKILSISITPGNSWSGADGETLLTVGDDADQDRLYTITDFSQLDTQFQEEIGFTYSSATEVKVYVTQGNASAGSAKITLQYVGTIQ